MIFYSNILQSFPKYKIYIKTGHDNFCGISPETDLQPSKPIWEAQRPTKRGGGVWGRVPPTHSSAPRPHLDKQTGGILSGGDWKGCSILITAPLADGEKCLRIVGVWGEIVWSNTSPPELGNRFVSSVRTSARCSSCNSKWNRSQFVSEVEDESRFFSEGHLKYSVQRMVSERIHFTFRERYNKWIETVRI